MNAAKKRIETRERKKTSIRKSVLGNQARPRVTIFRSANHIYAQAIDDLAGQTLCSISTTQKEVKEALKGHAGNKASAAAVGKLFGEKLKAQGIEKIVFDRNGYLYHGRVKCLADGIREAGIQF